jgi:integrase/recombinase XerD
VCLLLQMSNRNRTLNLITHAIALQRFALMERGHRKSLQFMPESRNRTKKPKTTMVYSFARVGTAVIMKIGDYFQHRKRWWLRLHEKGGKRHEVPCHPSLEEYLNAWISAAGITCDKNGPLFRSMGKGDRLGERAMSRFDVLHMIKCRAEAAVLPYSTCYHTFRAIGITTYLQNGGTLEHAQTIANHELPRTTKLYDLTREERTFAEVERIKI